MNKYKVCVRVREGDLIKFKLLNFYAKDEGQAIKNAHNMYKYSYDDVKVCNIKLAKKYNGVFIDNLFSIFTFPLVILITVSVLLKIIL